MIKEPALVAASHSSHDAYAASRIRERALNEAIVHADISSSFEEQLEIFNTFYADDVAATSDTGEKPVRGKARLRAALLNFLIPLHIMAEVGGLRVSIRVAAVAGDAASETHSSWTLELVGVSGKRCTVTWRTLRKWEGAQIIYEHHYDHKQTDDILSLQDLSFGAPSQTA